MTIRMVAIPMFLEPGLQGQIVFATAQVREVVKTGNFLLGTELFVVGCFLEDANHLFISSKGKTASKITLW